MEDDDNTYPPPISSMRDSVSRTVPNPLNGTSRREFKKILANTEGGSLIFHSIDNDVMKIMECLANISETTYDSYAKAAKRVSSSQSIPQDPNQLVGMIKDGQKKLDELTEWKNKYAMLDTIHEKHLDLYSNLYHASVALVDECSKISPISAEKLKKMMEDVEPDTRKIPKPFDLRHKSDDFLRKFAKESDTLLSAFKDYAKLQRDCMDLFKENQELNRRLEASSNKVSPPCSGPPVRSITKPSREKESKKKKRKHPI